ncbi:MAG: hypothetical protein ABL995_13065 [Bryobacteraceae bacterium]
MRFTQYLLAAVALSSPVWAQSNVPDLSGMWLVQDPGSGSFEEWFANVPKPELRPAIVEDNKKLEAAAKAGAVVNTARRTAACPIGNFPLMMASSPALNLVQTRDEILLGAESNRARFIYMDGRDHSETKEPGYRVSGLGHSVGRWEGNTLVVDTMAFPAQVCDNRHPQMATPAGGRAKETTRLTERFQLVNHDELTITFTYEDDTVFVKPHTFTYKFKRVPEGTPFESADDPRDTAFEKRQYGSVETPKQK